MFENSEMHDSQSAWAPLSDTAVCFPARCHRKMSKSVAEKSSLVLSSVIEWIPENNLFDVGLWGLVCRDWRDQVFRHRSLRALRVLADLQREWQGISEREMLTLILWCLRHGNVPSRSSGHKVFKRKPQCLTCFAKFKSEGAFRRHLRQKKHYVHARRVVNMLKERREEMKDVDLASWIDNGHGELHIGNDEPCRALVRYLAAWYRDSHLRNIWRTRTPPALAHDG